MNIALTKTNPRNLIRKVKWGTYNHQEISHYTSTHPYKTITAIAAHFGCSRQTVYYARSKNKRNTARRRYSRVKHPIRKKPISAYLLVLW